MNVSTVCILPGIVQNNDAVNMIRHDNMTVEFDANIMVRDFFSTFICSNTKRRQVHLAITTSPKTFSLSPTTIVT